MTAPEQNWIRPLPERVINKIAAGEVIERPAAVVKELVENSIDAGATRIDIIVEDSGTSLIRIIDNGCGISEEQVEVAFARHATSKIRSFDDLNNLYSYGFRGEALPSVASVSRLRLVTRTAGATAGTEIIYEGGVLQSKQPLAAPPGTAIEVENLFFNTPARRKFLRAEATEARHISRTVMGLAIGRPDLAFSYSLNGRKVLALTEKSSLGDRVAAVLAAGKSLIEVQGEAGTLKVSGYVGPPELVQSNRHGQFIFINTRYIFSPVLAHGFVAAYGELIPKGSYPVGALLLTVDTGEVDVNVHPTKAEVRLSREREVHDALLRIVRESLLEAGLVPSLKSISTDAVSPAGKPPLLPGGRPVPGNAAFVPGAASGEVVSQRTLAELYRAEAESETGPPADNVSVDTATGEVLGPADDSQRAGELADGLRLVGRLSDLYLLFQLGEDLYVVDQHTAHERVLFEETLRRIEKGSAQAQTLLFPVQIELNPQQLALFDEAADYLRASGFSVAPFGGRTVSIDAVPVVLSKKSPGETFLKILDDIQSLKKAGYDMNKAMAQTIACRSAVMAGDSLTDQEARHLVTRLLRCENKYSCPHGRPTFVRISREDLDKQFGRT
ncbi:MAG: DNA mismatch repair endonuclease MutL [Candidatus Zixiibacteriota bacterium]|nr:MAG: DNA mismatch repair endonuclease MutL [candidate division Zixibacteria bacterium]